MENDRAKFKNEFRKGNNIEINFLFNELNEIANILASSILTMKGKK